MYICIYIYVCIHAYPQFLPMFPFVPVRVPQTLFTFASAWSNLWTLEGVHNAPCASGRNLWKLEGVHHCAPCASGRKLWKLAGVHHCAPCAAYVALLCLPLCRPVPARRAGESLETTWIHVLFILWPCEKPQLSIFVAKH